MSKRMLEYCPNCFESWGPGSEEWQFQCCDSCGYPQEDNDDDFDNDYDDGEEDPIGYHCTCCEEAFGKNHPECPNCGAIGLEPYY